MFDVNVNYWVVLLAGVVSMALGALWYSPVLFGKEWMKHSKISKKDIEKAKKKGMGKAYFVNLLSVLVMVYVLAHVVSYVGATSVLGGAVVGAWMWLGFVATVGLNVVLWEGKSLNLYFLNMGYQLVSLIIAGALLAVL